MANVDPFVIQWPRAWEQDPEIGPVIHYLNRFLHDLWIRTGGSSDAIESVELAEKYPWPTTITTQQDSFDYPVKVIPAKQFNAVTTTTSYTANSWDYIRASSNALITFPEYPSENDVIIIRNDDGSKIKLNGNGRNMNDETTGILTRKGRSVTFHYFVGTNDWVAE